MDNMIAALHFGLPPLSVATRHSWGSLHIHCPQSPGPVHKVTCRSFYCLNLMQSRLSFLPPLNGQLLDSKLTTFSRSLTRGHPGFNSVSNEISMLHAFCDKNRARDRTPRNVQSRARLGGDGDSDVGIYEEAVAEDYYALLGLTPDATQNEIKKAYYSCMKSCHPDLSGNNPSVNEFCMFVNEVYEVLSDPEQRLVYDEINGYSIAAVNPFKDKTTEPEYAFVDEFTCIGCKNCAHTAPKTFEIEENFGRARVASQFGNPALVEMAIQTCPVDCIYWVTAAQLALLEDEMRSVERVNVGLMLSGMGYQSPDVFGQASWKWEKRQARAVERARIRMMKDSAKNGAEAWWTYHWGSKGEEKSGTAAADKYAKEKAAKTAAAARRWREYSRHGVYRKIRADLPCGVSFDTEQEDAEKEKAGAK